MTMQPKDIGTVPEETVRVARAAFPKGNAYLTLRDELSGIYDDRLFADLFPNVGQPAESPGRLALVTVLQFAEGLTDRQAADAVRSRIDWKYLLGLELADPGFDFSVLSEFRSRLLAGQAEERLLERLIEVLKERKLIKERSQQRTDSTQIRAAIRRINRLEKVGETLRAALNALAVQDPAWLKAHVPVSWYQRYATRIEDSRLPKDPQTQEQLALQIGQDGRQLLNWVFAADTAQPIREESAVEILRRVWIQEYYQTPEEITWRGPENTPPGEIRIHSPYDPEARYAEKRGNGWVGYKIHLTETCETDTPHIIVQVATTPAPQPDFEAIAAIQADLAHKQVLPGEHLMDQGYMNIHQVVMAQDFYGIQTIGRPMPDSSWQAKENQGFDLPHFGIDWQHQNVLCPMGHSNRTWREEKDASGKAVIKVEFSAQACRSCSQRIHCTTRSTGGRTLTFRPQPEYEALFQLRQDVQTDAFKSKYRKRAGVEGTLSQGVRGYDLRQTRYIGLTKTHLQHVATAVAINLARVFAWFSKIPLAKSRISPFSALEPSVG
jgi:transposase